MARKCTKENFAKLVAALEMATAAVELHTGNGAQSQPAWPTNKAGEIDYKAIAAANRALLASLAK